MTDDLIGTGFGQSDLRATPGMTSLRTWAQVYGADQPRSLLTATLSE